MGRYALGVLTLVAGVTVGACGDPGVVTDPDATTNDTGVTQTDGNNTTSDARDSGVLPSDGGDGSVVNPPNDSGDGSVVNPNDGGDGSVVNPPDDAGDGSVVNPNDGGDGGGTTPSLAVNSVMVAEGNSGTTTATFTVTLSAPATQQVTVQYATSNGTATTADNDYASSMGALTFDVGDTTKTITVNVNGDTVNEANETFQVTLSNPVGATIMTASGTGTITDDDPVPSLSIADVSVIEGNAGNTATTFTVTLSAASGQPVTVSYQTANGTAMGGSDFTAVPATTLMFAPGETSKQFTVNVTGDTTAEPNETFTVTLSSPTNATLGTATATATIQNDDGAVIPRISIADAMVTEGNSGTTTLAFNVTLDTAPATGQTVTVQFATANGTGVLGANAGGTAPTGGLDYNAASGTVTFTAGQTMQTVNVTVNGDALNEGDETFTATLSNATGGNIARATATGTITNDDAQPTISVNDVSVTEGAAGVRAAVFTATLSAPSGRPVSVNFTTADGTGANPALSGGAAAQGGQDYVAGTGGITFAAGTTTQTFSIVVNGDTLNEADETFLVNLMSPTNATLSDMQGVGTITNDDALPSISISNVVNREGNAGVTNYSFLVQLSAPSGRSVTVDYATANGAGANGATAGSDYVAANGTLTFNAGSTQQFITVQVNGDTVVEGTESFLVNLSNVAAATLMNNQATGTIFNDDGGGLFISIDDVTRDEVNVGAMVTYTFTVSLSAPVPTGQTVTVDFATANGSATAGADYTAATGTVTFTAGQQTRPITVTVLGDNLDENNEQFVVNLTNAMGGQIADSQGVGVITDNDPTPTLSISDVTLNETNTGTTTATFAVTLSAASGRLVLVNYATADGTAQSGGTASAGGQDYLTTSGILLFTPGTTTQNVTVTINGDTLNEINETFLVNLSGAANATIADGQGQGTITNDDAVPTLSINDVTAAEGTGVFTLTRFTFTVTLSAASGQTVTVNFATAGGTAVPGDFFPANGALTFNPGVTSQTITVTVLGDTNIEPNETFFVNLTNPTNATLSDGQGLGTINNDD